jgi:hypothetical protein
LKEKRGKIPVQQDERNLLPGETNLSGSSKNIHIGSSSFDVSILKQVEKSSSLTSMLP